MSTGKLIAFAAPDTGIGKSVCAASLALRLAKRWKCLALDLDTVTYRFRTYLCSAHSGRGAVHGMDFSDALPNSRLAGTGVPNLTCVDWHWPAGSANFWEPARIDGLLKSVIANPADCVLASLAAGMAPETMEFFSAADIPIIVTNPIPRLISRSLEVLAKDMARNPSGKTVYFIFNRIQRGGEVREASALIENARDNLGLTLRVLGSVQYDPELEKSFRPGSGLSATHFQGVASGAFEDMAFVLERLLPSAHPEFHRGPAVAARTAARVVPVPGIKPPAEMTQLQERAGLEKNIKENISSASRTRLQLAAKVVMVQLGQAVLETDSMISDLKAGLRTRDDRIALLESRAREDELMIAQLRRELADRVERIARLESELNQNAQTVRDVYHYLQKHTLKADGISSDEKPA